MPENVFLLKKVFVRIEIQTVLAYKVVYVTQRDGNPAVDKTLLSSSYSTVHLFRNTN